MVVARLMAEITVLSILLVMPVFLLVGGQFAGLPRPLQILALALPCVSLLALPCYAMMTWAVQAGEDGLTAVSAFRRRFVPWQAVRGLSLKASWSLRRYVVELDSGEISFPVWLDSVGELVALIRDRLPPGSDRRAGPRLYGQDWLGLAHRLVRVMLGLIFIGVFWAFFAHVGLSASANQSDRIILLLAALCLSGIVGWRSLSILLMPRSVLVDDGGLTVTTLFSKKAVPWSSVRGVSQPFFLLPDGTVVETAAGRFLLGDDLDDADTLIESIRRHQSG